MIENLKQTVELMTSEDYQKRFEGEVLQLCIRINRLRDTLINIYNGTCNFTPKCSTELLEAQLDSMEELLRIYAIRASVEGCRESLAAEPEYIIAMKAADLNPYYNIKYTRRS